MKANEVQKIREEVEKLKSQLLRGACSSQVAMETRCKEEAYNEVLAILDTMQEEPIRIKEGCRYRCLRNILNTDTGKFSFVKGKIYSSPRNDILIEETGVLCNTSEDSSGFELVEEPKSKFEQSIQEGDNIVYNEDLGCRVNLSQLKRVAKKEEPKKCMYTKDNYTDEDRKVLCDGCEEVCEYAKNGRPVSIWHDASEETPTSGSNILMVRKEEEDTNYPPIAGCFHGTNSRLDGRNWGYYNGFCYNEIEPPVKWAYIDDILKLSNIQRTIKNREPVNEDLRTAANVYVYENAKEEWSDCDMHNAFVAGAKWQRQREREAVKMAKKD